MSRLLNALMEAGMVTATADPVTQEIDWDVDVLAGITLDPGTVLGMPVNGTGRPQNLDEPALVRLITRADGAGSGIDADTLDGVAVDTANIAYTNVANTFTVVPQTINPGTNAIAIAINFDNGTYPLEIRNKPTGYSGNAEVVGFEVTGTNSDLLFRTTRNLIFTSPSGAGTCNFEMAAVRSVDTTTGFTIQTNSSTKRLLTCKHNDTTNTGAYFQCQTSSDVVVAQILETGSTVKSLDAVTSAVTNVLTLGHESSGTPAAGFGGGLQFQLESSTTSDQNAALVAVTWGTATHATRASIYTISTYYTSTAQEGIRLTSASGGVTVTVGNDANFSGLVVNENGNDADTRIEGDTDVNLVFVDASTDRVGIGTATPACKLDVNGTICADNIDDSIVIGSSTPTALSADQNNYAPTLGRLNRWQTDNLGNRTVTGLAGGVDGMTITIVNVGSPDTITLSHESASSTAANRFSNGPSALDITLGAAGDAATFIYDGTSSRWRYIP